MKNFLLMLLCFACIAKTYGQTPIEKNYGHIVIAITKENDSIYAKVEVKSAPRGIDSPWVRSLERNINHRLIGIRERVEKGKHIVSVVFIASKDGSLSEISCKNDPGFGLCEEVMAVIKKSKNWLPGNVRSVSTQHTTSVTSVAGDYVKAQHLYAVSPIKSKIDSVRNFVYVGPSSDLLPAEFNSPALENEYYCDSAYFNGHVFILRFRDNHSFIYETFYKPYNWARIEFGIGNYRISSDTIYITYRPLLPGKADKIYLSPRRRVSWIPPRPPEYLLIDKNRLFDPFRQRSFYTLTDKPQFDLGGSK